MVMSMLVSMSVPVTVSASVAFLFCLGFFRRRKLALKIFQAHDHT